MEVPKDGSNTHKLEKGKSKNMRSKESLHDSDDLDADGNSPAREEEKNTYGNGSKMRSGSTNPGNNKGKFVDPSKNPYK
jgi:hypothetical protein